MREKAFTLVELMITLAIIGILSAIILLGVTQYINKSKDSSIIANLIILIPAGEVYYKSNGNSYENFCDSSVVKNALSQLPQNTESDCYDPQLNRAGFCCFAQENRWAACVPKFSDRGKAFCVDSRGVKKEIKVENCVSDILECYDYE